MPTLIVGSATVDEQVAPDGVPRLQLGGVVTYAGAAFAQGGLSPIAVCNIGGPWAVAARGLLAKLDIRLCGGHSEAMTSFRNTVGPDGERKQDLVSMARAIDADAIARALEGVERPHVHLGPLHGEDISEAALHAVAARAETVTLDVQGLLRASAIGAVREQAAHVLPHALAVSRVVKAGQEELAALLTALEPDAGTGDPPSLKLRRTSRGSGIGGKRTAERLLQEYDIDELVVTCGSAGGYVVSSHSDKTTFSAAPIERLRDTTGAGDVFFAEYLVARLYEGATVREACERAARVAARHVAGDFIEPKALALA